MLYLYVALYLLALIIGAMLRGDRALKARRLGIRLTLFAVLTFLILLVLISRIDLGGLYFAFIPLFVLQPLLAIGLGLVLSTLLRAPPDARGTPPGMAILTLATLLPALALWLFWSHQTAQQAQRRASLAAFQASDVTGLIGTARVHFPASPQILTIHACDDDYGRCHTRFWQSGAALQEALTVGAAPTQFQQITVVPVHATCDGPAAPRGHCLAASHQGAWCSTRPDWQRTVWCASQPRHRVVFAPDIDDSTRFADLVSAQDREWITVDSNALRRDHLGKPILITCNATRDMAMADNPQASRLCRFRYRIAADVTATITLDRFDPALLRDAATAMLAYTDALWSSIDQP